MHSPAAAIDHTLLKPEACPAQISELCEEAVEWGFAAVCVPPVYVPLCAERLYGAGVGLATVIGFPFGYATTRVKAFETDQAIAQGADEVDMVMTIGAALAGEWSRVEEDVRAVVKAAEGAAVKVILECSALPEAIKRQAAEVALDAGAAYLKTSTGYGAHGATLDDVQLLHSIAGDRARVKAAGGIRDLDSCCAMLAAGAARIGTSSGVAIMQQWQKANHGA